MARITLPEGEDPVDVLTTKVGSPQLNARMVNGWAVQYSPGDTTLSLREREVARTVYSHLLGCAKCQATRLARDIPAFAGIDVPEELYENIFAPASWPGYSERERLIVEISERYAENYRDMIDDEPLWTRLKANFSDVELVDIFLLLATWDGSVRMHHLLVGMADGCATPSAIAAAVRDGRPVELEV